MDSPRFYELIVERNRRSQRARDRATAVRALQARGLDDRVGARALGTA
jgi:hypothetical protein